GGDGGAGGGGAGGGAGVGAEPRTIAIGPRSLLLATDTGLLELLHANRSYAVLARAGLPQGVARVESLAFVPLAGVAGEGAGEAEPPRGRWLLAGLDHQAECVLLAAEHPAGPWTDLGVATLDAALAQGPAGEKKAGEKQSDENQPGQKQPDEKQPAEPRPIAWLPGAFTVDGGVATLCIRGERGAAASWPAGAPTLEADALTIRWLDGGGGDEGRGR
ncbi:MAG: hypothetical protein ACIAS6_13745, partial [Phycisphaerales bacterium JB060]